MKKKAERTLPRIHKNNTSKKTVPPTKKNKRAKGEALFRHYHRSMDEMTASTETEPEPSSSDSSTESSSDEESQ
ncbi:rCG36311 [Rattus norvegicus]|uniref:RCG36311 n=1 Tax=Rattus norvegicus TaxID=10116 RepID=A6IQ41_RAT|nr:rCG36311 [Rattus norvegicus]